VEDVSQRRAFTLVEAMIALAIGSMVMGAAMILYHQGTKSFYKTTEHAAFREESLLCLEQIARDVEQLMVSEGTKPSGKYEMVEPYELTGASYPFMKFDPVTNTQKDTGARAYEGIKFIRYHSTETDATGMPVLVGKMVEYNAKPVNPANPQAGKNLYRNGSTRPLNKIPLRDIAFVTEPIEVTADQIGAASHAVLTVMIVPAGGTWATWQNMSRDTVDRLKREKGLLARTFHLAGYETFYTLLLNESLRITAATGGNPGSLTGVYKAVYDDAKQSLTPAQFASVESRFQTGSATFKPPLYKQSAIYRMDYRGKFDDATAGSDRFFSSLPVQEGAKPTSGQAAGGNTSGGSENSGGENEENN
jgi:prepilin-type N-terminal cleavage/methylation domain-containing protein